MFDAIYDGEEAAVKYFNNWIEEVKQHVPAERLLVYSAKEGWEPLCKFLNVPIPHQTYPNSNDTKAMLWRFKERKIRAYCFVYGVPIVLGMFFYWFSNM